MVTGANGTWSDQMTPEWIAMEHYRLHTVEQWPDGPYKVATLNAIRASLAGLMRDVPETQAPACAVCSKRKATPGIIKFPTQPKPLESRDWDAERIAS